MEALLGSLTGILGAFATKILAYFAQKEKNKHEIAIKKMDIEMMRDEYKFRQIQAETEADERMMVSSFENDSLSYAKRVKPGKYGGIALIAVDVVRGLIRPVLTVFLIIIVMIQHFRIEDLLRDVGVANLSANQITNLYASALDMVLYLACTAVAWWFGSRPPKRMTAS